MNDKAIVKHFQARWAADAPLLIGRQGDWYLAAEGFILLRLPLDHLLLDSRRVVPSFPETGRSLRYLRGGEPVEREGHLADTVQGWINDPERQQLEVTDWLKEHAGDLYRAFQLPDGARLFVNEDFVQMLVGKDDSLESYQFYAKPLPVSDETPAGPVMAEFDGEWLAALMPMRIYEQGPLFPIR